MSVPIFRIEVADPIEGDAIRAALRARGFVVVKRGADELAQGSEAALVVLALDAPGGLAALASLRARGGPVALLVGAPPHGEPAAGSIAWLARPVDAAALAQRAESHLVAERSGVHEAGDPRVAYAARGERDRGDALRPDSESADASVVHRVGRDSGPERTLRLDADGVPLALSGVFSPAHVGASEPVGSSSSPASSSPASSSQPSPSSPASSSPASSSQPAPLSAPPDASAAAPASHPSEPASDISPRLQDILVAADRRVFPGAEPLDLRFAAGHEPPDRLVPDELLEDVAVSPDAPDEDPLESFTQIGPVVPQSGTPAPLRTPGSGIGSSRTPSPFTPRASRFDRAGGTSAGSEPGEHTGALRVGGAQGGVGVRTGTGTGAGDEGAGRAPTTSSARAARGVRAVAEPRVTGTPGMDPSAADTRPPLARRRGPATQAGEGRPIDAVPRAGTTDDAGLVALFARLALSRAEGELRLRDLEPALGEVCVTLLDGEARSFDADVATRVVAQLRRERRIVDEPADEPAAQQLLERRVAAGLLSRFELERRLARAREEALYAVLASRRAHYELAPLEPTRRDALPHAPRPFSRSLLALVVEGARRRLEPARVASLLGPGPVRLLPTADCAARVAEAGLAPELAALVCDAAGATLDALTAAAPPEEGVAGAVFALVRAGALRVEAAPAAPPVSHEAAAVARAELAALALLAEDADYFAVLGVARDARERELHAAHEERVRAVRGLPLEALGLASLEPAREAVLAALDDALDVLADARLRVRYARALEA